MPPDGMVSWLQQVPCAGYCSLPHVNGGTLHSNGAARPMCGVAVHLIFTVVVCVGAAEEGTQAWACMLLP